MKSAVIAALLACLAAFGQTPPPGRRLALVIGNQNYTKLRPLPAVPQETQLITSALTAANFKVSELKNATLDDLEKSLQSFTDAVQPGDVCFFYYSGYAVQDGQDDYLLSIDFDPAANRKLDNVAYPVTLLAQNLEEKKASLKIFFLEGARRIGASIRDTRPGLRVPDNSVLTEILFAIPTATGLNVDTPPDQMGLFTTALAAAINRQGLPITQLMPEILKEVMEKSQSRQQPANGTKLTTEFYFHKPAVTVVTPTAPVPQQNHRDREFYTYIPPGTFLMGCVSGDTKCDKDEKPQHKVTISKGFWLGQNEVQVESYKKFLALEKKGAKMPNDYGFHKKWSIGNQPMSGMTWQDAVDYCTWAGGRLPTEAEWEYAARGGKENQIDPFDSTDPDKRREKANFDGIKGNDQFDGIAPVRQFDANDYGLYDMSGNVWEFVSDFYGPYSEAPAIDPKGPDDGKLHVRRGGSFNSDPKNHLRISVRVASKAEVNVGFRCAMDDTPETRRRFQNQ